MRTVIFLLSVMAISLYSVCRASIPWTDNRNPHQNVTMNYLYEACGAKGNTGGGDIPYFDCESYVYGVLDSYIFIRNSIPMANRSCFPRDIPPWFALEIASPLLTNANGNKNAAPLIIQALHDRYPCQRNNVRP